MSACNYGRRSTDKRQAPADLNGPAFVLAAASAGARVLRETGDLEAAIAAVKAQPRAVQLELAA